MKKYPIHNINTITFIATCLTSSIILFFFKLLTAATLIGRFLSAVWLVEEERRHSQEPAPAPRRLTVERAAVD